MCESVVLLVVLFALVRWLFAALSGPMCSPLSFFPSVCARFPISPFGPVECTLFSSLCLLALARLGQGCVAQT